MPVTAEQLRQSAAEACIRLTSAKLPRFVSGSVDVQMNDRTTESINGYVLGNLIVAKNVDTGTGWAVYTRSGLLAVGHPRFHTGKLTLPEAKRWASWLVKVLDIDQPAQSTLERCVSMFRFWRGEEWVNLEQLVLWAKGETS